MNDSAVQDSPLQTASSSGGVPTYVVRIIYAVIILFIASLAVSVYLNRPVSLQYEVVTTPEAMAKGLSGRESLLPGHAMFFKWEDDAERCMWAKDMKFDVEVFFLNEHGDAVSRAVMKAGSTMPVCSMAPVRYAIETNVGEVA